MIAEAVRAPGVKPVTERHSISYLVPAYNCAGFLHDAVNSIVNKNLSNGDEILIVDDASTDATTEVMQQLAAEVPQVRLLKHRCRKGSAAAGRNAAIDAANNDLFFALDADNILPPRSIEPLVSHLQREKADSAAFAEVRYFTSSINTPTHSWLFRPEITFADALAGHHWPGPDGNYLFTRDSWVRAGRYDESLGGGIDSWAFGIRQLASGARMVTLPGSFYFHRWGYESAFVVDAKDGLLSIKAARALLALADLLEPESLDYILSPEKRYTWFEALCERPIRLRGRQPGISGQVTRTAVKKNPLWMRLRRYAARKLAP